MDSVGLPTVDLPPPEPPPSSFKDKIKTAALKVHDYSAARTLQLVGGLVMEQKNDDGTWIMSLGRIAFWIVFFHLVYAWHVSRVPDDTEMNAFYALLAYQGGKIAKSAITDSIAALRGDVQ